MGVLLFRLKGRFPSKEKDPIRACSLAVQDNARQPTYTSKVKLHLSPSRRKKTNQRIPPKNEVRFELQCTNEYNAGMPLDRAIHFSPQTSEGNEETISFSITHELYVRTAKTCD
jgi:hypothetical protein